MVSMLYSSVVDCGFQCWSGQNRTLWNWYLLLLWLA